MAGVRVDDLVLRIDEQETRLLSKEGMSALLQQSAAKDQVCLMLVRPYTSGPQNLPVSSNIEEDARKSVHFEGTEKPLPAVSPVQLPKRLPPVNITNYETGDKHTDSLFAKAAVVCTLSLHAYLLSPIWFSSSSSTAVSPHSLLL